ncbi:MAG: hypothetical protein ACREPE_08510, partial [Lysobacter sp.]
YSAREAFEQALESACWGPIAVTALLWAMLHLLSPVFTWIVLRGVGADISYRSALEIHIGRLPARYLPGGIWHTVSRVMDLHGLGVSRLQLSILVLMENLVPLGITLAGGGLLLYLSGDSQGPALAAAAGGLLLLACIPFALRHRMLLSKHGFTHRYYLTALTVVAAFWAIAASAFACYWLAFPSTEIGGSLLKLFGAYLLAWAAGFAAIFAPQGIGVFEAVAAMLLPGALPFGGVVALAAGFRAVVLIGDSLAFGVLLLYRRSVGKATQATR